MSRLSACCFSIQDIIQRYRCPHYRRRFSSQTFSTTYWLRYRHLLKKICTYAF